VTAEGTFQPGSDVDRIFGPIVHAQTYRHLLYSVVEFPLGIFYFGIMIAGLSAGFATAIVVIGFVFLAITLAIARVFGRMERELSKALLGAVFHSNPPERMHWRAMLRDRRTWTTVVYLVLRFPLGIAGFVASVLMLAAVPAMAAPLLYVSLPYWIAGERVVNSEEAILVSLFGCLFFLLDAHLVNGVAALSRRVAVALL